MRMSFWGLAGVSLLSACSSYGPPGDLAGATRETIVARMGPPDVQRTVEGGTRLEYPRGPYGRHTYFVYLDADGRATRSEQVLTEARFNQITPGMTQDALLLALGRPSEVWRLGRNWGTVWNYRYENNFCLWFQIEVTQEQTVRSAGYGEPPECNRRGDIP